MGAVNSWLQMFITFRARVLTRISADLEPSNTIVAAAVRFVRRTASACMGAVNSWLQLFEDSVCMDAVKRWLQPYMVIRARV